LEKLRAKSTVTATAYGTFSWFFAKPPHRLKDYFCEFKYRFETAKSGDRELAGSIPAETDLPLWVDQAPALIDQCEIDVNEDILRFSSLTVTSQPAGRL